MKIRIELTFEVDPEAWAEANLLEPNEVRRDVKMWATSMILEELSDKRQAGEA